MSFQENLKVSNSDKIKVYKTNCKGLMTCSIGEYIFHETLGQGTYGQVKLATHIHTNQSFAIKVISKSRSTQFQPLQKEILVHKSIPPHPNVIQLVDVKEDGENVYIIMEVASEGELFAKIEPDVGVDEQVAHFYFKQLIQAVEHLHSQGIAHRDLKPENLLLDSKGNLKLVDFGFATVFYHKGQTRKLNTPCGSSVYMAPDVLSGSYEGPLVDIWSAGVILFVLLTGTTPWARACNEDQDFCLYSTTACHDYYPWNRFSHPLRGLNAFKIIDLIERIICVDSSRRASIADIKNHPWTLQSNSFMGPDGLCCDSAAITQQLLSNMNRFKDAISFTQPESINICSQNGYISFSQPDHMQLSQALTQSTPDTSYHKFNRLTRFYSKLPVDQILSFLDNLLENLIVPHKLVPKASKISISTVDQRKCPLSGEIFIQPLDKECCAIVFIKNRGDPLEFKRFFKVIFQHSSEIAVYQ